MEQDQIGGVTADVDVTSPGDPTGPTDAPATDAPAEVPDDLDGLLDGVADLPLREQVVVFEQVHATLTERLSERDA